MKTRWLILPFVLLLLPFAGWAQDAEAVPATELQGKVTSHNNKTVVLTVDPGATPAMGDSVDVFKYFERTVLNGTMTGWLGVALARVTAVRGTQVTLTIVEERSEIIMNGSKVDHFKLGNRMKLTWPYEKPEPVQPEKVDTDE
jgi:hypothetical protein